MRKIAFEGSREVTPLISAAIGGYLGRDTLGKSLIGAGIGNLIGNIAKRNIAPRAFIDHTQDSSVDPLGTETSADSGEYTIPSEEYAHNFLSGSLIGGGLGNIASKEWDINPYLGTSLAALGGGLIGTVALDPTDSTLSSLLDSSLGWR